MDDFRSGAAEGAAPSRLAPERPAPLRIAWVVEIPVPYRLGLYQRLRSEAGFDLRLLFCAARQPGRDWSASLEELPHRVLSGVTLAARPREQFFLRINPQVWSELSRFRPDIVIVGGYAHVTMQLAMLWCRRTGTPYLINSESHHRRRRGPLLRVLKRLPLRFFIRGAAACLPTGTLACDYLLSYGGPADRMFTLPNTCDVPRFARESDQARRRRAALRAALGFAAEPLVLYVGRLAPGKGLDTLLRAFAALRRSGEIHRDGQDGQVRKEPDKRRPGPGPLALRAIHPPVHPGNPVHPVNAGIVPERLNARTPERLNAERLNPPPSLLLVGDGELRAELASLAAALGIAERVRFAGSRPWSELPALYAAADLFVLPSTFEAWGAVVNEALACGLPVLVSDQVGCGPDLVRPGENGWIVPAGDAAALAAALRAALADPEKLSAMGAASARLAPAWSEDTCLEAVTAAVRAAGKLRTCS